MAAATADNKWTPNKIALIKGQSDDVAIFLLQADGSPLNVTGASAIYLMYKDSAGTVLTKSAVDGYSRGKGDKAFWIYGFSFSSDETSAMPEAKNQTIVIKIMYGSDFRYQTIANCLSVSAMPLES